jgi:hypothetical protein
MFSVFDNHPSYWQNPSPHFEWSVTDPLPLKKKRGLGIIKIIPRSKSTREREMKTGRRKDCIKFKLFNNSCVSEAAPTNMKACSMFIGKWSGLVL